MPSGVVEPPMEDHPLQVCNLTGSVNPGSGHGLVGSLTGAVASQKVTEAHKGSLSTPGTVQRV